MTDRLKGITVVFKDDMREDDAEHIINAVLMIKGVLKVTTLKLDADDYINRERIKSEMRKKLFDVLDE